MITHNTHEPRSHTRIQSVLQSPAMKSLIPFVLVGVVGALFAFTIVGQSTRLPASHPAQVCAEPPPGTDPTTLSDAQLAYYAMLPRPRGVSATSAVYTNWESLVRASRHRVCSAHIGKIAWGSILPAHQTDPFRPLYAAEDESVNYSGVVAVPETGSYYSQVEAEWTIPKMSIPNDKTSTTGAWVALDGYRDHNGDGNLLQAGFGEDLNPKMGPPSCYTFWEDTSDTEQIHTINYADNHVSCGDDIYATLIQNQRYAKNVSLYIIDRTSKTWVGLNPIPPSEVPWPPNGSTASWIVEQQSGVLANFGALTFNNAKAAAYGYEDPIGTWPTHAIRQWDCSPMNTPTCTVSNNTMAYPGPIHNSLWFNDYWVRYN